MLTLLEIDWIGHKNCSTAYGSNKETVTLYVLNISEKA